jgi:hypothetical protein
MRAFAVDAMRAPVVLVNRTRSREAGDEEGMLTGTVTEVPAGPAGRVTVLGEVNVPVAEIL